MSFERFADGLAFMLIKELGGAEIPVSELRDFPVYRLVTTESGTCVITKGDGLTHEQLSSHSEQLMAQLNAGTFPSRSGVACLIYVFEQLCPPDMRKEIAAIAKRPFFSVKTSAVFGGYADLSDGSVGFNSDIKITGISSQARNAMQQFRKGELSIEGADNYREALLKLEQSHNEFAERLSSTTPWATYTLTAFCVLMFLWESIAGGSSNSMMLLRMGANSSTLVSNGEWWRTVGSMFLHGNFIHLLMNMYALVAVGTVLERYLGNLRFLALYTLSGIAGSLASVMMGTPLSVGASGAIFGLFGAAALIGYRYRNEIPVRFRNQLAGGMAINILYNLMYGFSHQGIDNSAHIGGLLAGLLFAFLVPPEVTATDKNRSLSGTLAALFTFISIGLFTTQGYVIYRAATIKDFASCRQIEYRDSRNRFSFLYPEALKVKQTEKSAILTFPGMAFEIFSVPVIKPLPIDELHREAVVRDLNRDIAMTVEQSRIELANGYPWLIIEGKKYQNGKGIKTSVAVMSRNRLVYLIYTFANEHIYADAVSVSQGLVKSFRTDGSP